MNKFITLTNKNTYENNKNGFFITDVEQLEFNKKHQIALTEFIYVNKIKYNLGII